MEIRTGDPFAREHSQYAVAVFLDEPLFEQMFPLIFAKQYGVNRKAAMRAYATLAPNQILSLGSKRGPALACLVIGTKPGSATVVEVTRCLRKFSRVADTGTALIADNFRLGPLPQANEGVDMGKLELLLRRADFPGTVYCPVGMDHYRLRFAGASSADERLTSTHMLVQPDGNISPSIPPTMLRFKSKK